MRLCPRLVLLLAPALLSGLSCTDLPTGPAETPGMRTRGVTLADWTPAGYQSPAAYNGIDAIAATGANTLVLVVTAYQDSPASATLSPDAARTPSNVSLSSAAARAIQNGMQPVFKPHVDLDTGAWRGTIGPPDAAAWFASYEAFVLPLADLAEAEGAPLFIVGTELAGTLDHEDRWRDVIAKVRARFSGKLTYAASWDEVQRVPFWDALDYVGVDFYAPVTERNNAGRFEILKGWQVWLRRLEILHGQSGLPVLLTEIGYRSVDGAGQRPYEFGNNTVLDAAEQADLYWGALAALAEKSWVEGVVWWNWLANGEGGPDNTDYTPSGKLAEEELRDAWNG